MLCLSLFSFEVSFTCIKLFFLSAILRYVRGYCGGEGWKLSTFLYASLNLTICYIHIILYNIHLSAASHFSRGNPNIHRFLFILRNLLWSENQGTLLTFLSCVLFIPGLLSVIEHCISYGRTISYSWTTSKSTGDSNLWLSDEFLNHVYRIVFHKLIRLNNLFPVSDV